MKLESKYEVQAAHRLSAGVPEGHPCRRLHGHRYNITVVIDGPVKAETGMLMEYADIDEIVWELLGMVDHRYLNLLGFHELYDDEKALAMYGPLPTREYIEQHLREPGLAAAVRRNSTVEHFVAWLYAELRHRFGGDASSADRDAFVSKVRIEEDSGHTAELP